MTAKQKKQVNIREIAKRAGVSVASVSRALSDTPTNKISQKSKEKILKICEEMHYYPNMHTVRMVTKRAQTVAFLAPDSLIDESKTSGRMDENLSAAITGAEAALSKNSIYLTLIAATESFINNREYLKLYRGKMVDGIIIWGWLDTESYINDLIDEKVPLVMIQCADEKLPVSSVVPQDREGMKMVIDHVVSLGHRKISLISPSRKASVGRARFDGSIAALKQHGLEPAWISSQQGFGIDIGYRAFQEIIKENPDTTCIIGSNDYSAIGAIQAAQEMNIKVPEEISIAGADGLDMHGLLNLTTYFSPAYQVGGEGAKILNQLIDNPKKKPIKKQIPVKFISGDTTRKPGNKD